MTNDAEHGPERFVGTVLAGRYEVTGVLGAGGMGIVLEARQVAMDRKVAVKLLHPGFATNRHAVARFVREMQVTSRLEHASTVRVYDFGETSDANGVHLFLVMELVQGRTLGKVLTEGPLALARVVAIGGQIARALEAAHGEGIVHRDLKPDNVMLVDRYGKSDVVKVLDFGIARFVDGAEGDGVGKLTAEGAVVGTPAYMSPEQATGAPIGPASDLYSLGVMLFEMTTGEVPFSAPTTVSLMVKHVQEAPPRPSELVAMPPRLEELILACLAKAPEARPASAKALADALDALGRELDAGAVPGVARVARADSERFGLQKARALAADTARTSGGSPVSEAATAKRVEHDDVPPKKSRAPWWIAGVVAVALAVVAVVMLVARTDEGRMTVEPAAPLAVADVVVDAAEASDGQIAVGREVVALEAAAAASSLTSPQVEPAAPDGCPLDAVAKARVAVRERTSEAPTLAREAVRGCPEWALAHVVLGQSEQAAKSWDAARAAFQRARELAPKWGLPLFDLALVELAAGEPEAARVALMELLGLAPEWPDARLLKAQAELARRDFATAVRDAEAATIATPERAEAWFLLGESHRALASAGSAATAKEAYCKAKALGMEAAARRCDAAP